MKKEITVTVNADLHIHASFGTILFGNILEECFPFEEHIVSFPPESDALLALPFLTGKRGTVSSITMVLGAIAGASKGVLRISLWDDADGVPGNQIALLVRVPLAGLPLRGKLIAFDASGHNLKPNSPYYLVLDASEIPNFSRNKPTTMPRLSSDEGTFGAQCAMTLIPSIGVSTWTPLKTVRPTWGYMQMSVLEGPAPLEPNLEPPLLITSIERTEAAVALTWRSQPGETYNVEFSATLPTDTWIEVADELLANEPVSTYEDTNAARRALPQGYYRVRVTP